MTVATTSDGETIMLLLNTREADALAQGDEDCINELSTIVHKMLSKRVHDIMDHARLRCKEQERKEKEEHGN
ncbi:TPA: hypothetical protein HA278_00985 [Candidatus Woesearchaeota archaeon]|nr:hypothetical protein [Candidatus Woesearchaeota archaeon]